MDRRTFLSRSLTAGLIYGLGAGVASAMDHGFDHSDPVVQWFESLKIPDDTPPKGGCCGKGDAYAIRILEDALGNSADKSDWGLAEITDGSAKQWPDGTIRTPIPNGTQFKFPKQKVNPPEDGNPTPTAWAFLSVVEAGDEASRRDGKGNYIRMIYCIIPLLPGV
jgi:hypothetical protein